jgi:type IV secretion system protein VirB8
MPNDIGPLFPTAPAPRVADRPLVLRQRVQDDVWEDSIRQARSGRKAAWTVAGVLIVVCAAQAAAIALMLPLREVVPYTVLVDRQTGYIETARGLKLGDLAEDEAIVQAMSAQYVLARETFDPQDFAERYDRVALWSLGSARDDYVAQFQANLPDSVLSSLRPGTRVEVTIKKVELLDAETARIRFETRRREPGLDLPERRDWQAVLTYRFTGAPMRMEDRLLNPLGFQVTAYRRDAETPTDSAPPAATEGAQAEPAPEAPPASGETLAPEVAMPAGPGDTGGQAPMETPAP